MYQPIFAQPSSGICLLLQETHAWALFLFYLGVYFKLDPPSACITCGLYLGGGGVLQNPGIWQPSSSSISILCYTTLKLCLLYNKYYLYHVVLFIGRETDFSLSQKEKKYVGFWLNGDWIPRFGYYLTSNWDCNSGTHDSSPFAPLASPVVGSAFHQSRILCLFSSSLLPLGSKPTSSPAWIYWWLQQPPNSSPSICLCLPGIYSLEHLKGSL